MRRPHYLVFMEVNDGEEVWAAAGEFTQWLARRQAAEAKMGRAQDSTCAHCGSSEGSGKGCSEAALSDEEAQAELDDEQLEIDFNHWECGP